MKFLRSEGYIKVDDSTEVVKDKLKEITYQEMLTLKSTPLTDKPFLGHFNGNQVSLELLTNSIKLFRPRFRIDIHETFNESILSIKAFPNDSIDKIIKLNIYGVIALLTIFTIPVFFETMMALVLIPLVIILGQVTVFFIILIVIFKSYINKEYKKAFTLIRRALEVDDEML